jgi:hypothetical protein
VEALLTYSKMFYLVQAGQARWVVHHQITNILAARIVKTSQGFQLTDDNGKALGEFSSVEGALHDLYEFS